mmetsp:Transcript_6133/g.38099  ORF Transcript_6133/g.38099 Transcript_6133/m.38099 type:complete len:209 (+) Transcript_6133:2846-3472(+)
MESLSFTVSLQTLEWLFQERRVVRVKGIFGCDCQKHSPQLSFVFIDGLSYSYDYPSEVVLVRHKLETTSCFLYPCDFQRFHDWSTRQQQLPTRPFHQHEALSSCCAMDPIHDLGSFGLQFATPSQLYTRHQRPCFRSFRRFAHRTIHVALRLPSPTKRSTQVHHRFLQVTLHLLDRVRPATFHVHAHVATTRPSRTSASSSSCMRRRH